jgi:ubiquinone biosynthesis protein
VKFGQVLSTRRDLLPPDVADELAQLQDRVPPFPARRPSRRSSAPSAARWTRCSASFDAEPVASASIAQVHFATLKQWPRGGGEGAAPGHAGGDRDDLQLMRTLAAVVERLSGPTASA